MSSHAIRHCAKCKETKPIGDFRKQRRKCRTCEYKRHREWTKTPSGQASLKKHLTSEKHLATRRAYHKSPQGKAYDVARRSNEEYKAMVRRSVDKYRFANPDLIKARSALTHAIRGRRIQKPLTCNQCGRQPGPRHLHAHHHKGYDRADWFNVTWLCVDCHAATHRK